MHVITPAEVEETLRQGDYLRIKGNYCIDAALVLRSKEGSYAPNKQLAGDLTSQLEEKLGKFVFPAVIPLRHLDLKLADNQYGLGFTIREDAEVIHNADILNKQGGY